MSNPPRTVMSENIKPTPSNPKTENTKPTFSTPKPSSTPAINPATSDPNTTRSISSYPSIPLPQVPGLQTPSGKAELLRDYRTVLGQVRSRGFLDIKPTHRNGEQEWAFKYLATHRADVQEISLQEHAAKHPDQSAGEAVREKEEEIVRLSVKLKDMEEGLSLLMANGQSDWKMVYTKEEVIRDIEMGKCVLEAMRMRYRVGEEWEGEGGDGDVDGRTEW